MISLKLHKYSLLAIFSVLLYCHKLQAQELIKAEKEWLIDYYFKDDTVFNNQLSEAALLIYQNKIQNAQTILFKLNTNGNKLKETALTYYIAYSYLINSKYTKAYQISDSIIKKISKNNVTRFHIELECLKTKTSSDSFNLKPLRIEQLQKSYLKQIKFARQQKYYFGFVQLCRRYAYFMMTKKPNVHNEKIYLLCVQLADVIDNKLIKAKCLGELASYYQLIGDLNKMNEYNGYALSLTEKIGFNSGAIEAYRTHAFLTSYTGEHDKALVYISKIIRYCANKKDIELLNLYLSLYASFLDKANRPIEANKYHLKSIEIANLLNIKSNIIYAKNTYYRMVILNNSTYSNNLKKELSIYFNFSKNTLVNIENDEPISYKNFYIANYAKYLFNIGHHKLSLKTTINLLNSGGNEGFEDGEILFLYKLTYDNYNLLGDYKHALNYYQKYINLNEELRKKVKFENLYKKELETKYTKEKNEQIRLREYQKKQYEVIDVRKKNIIKYTSFILCLLVIAFSFSIYHYRLKTKSERLLTNLNVELFNKNIEIQKSLVYTHKIEKDIILQKAETQYKINEFQLAQAELKALRSQMNPHFLFNAINSIQSYMLKNDARLASKYLTKFARLIRSVLENSKQEFVALNIEINTLELYIELEAMRNSFEFDYEIILEDGMESVNNVVPPMIFQPYVENAILHGITQLTDRRGILSVVFSINNNILKCVIDDNGIGRKEAMEIKQKKDIDRKSIGLEVTNNRIDILNKHNQMFAQVIIIDKLDTNNIALGTRVEIEITLNKKVAL